MYRPKNFTLEELLPEYEFNLYGEYGWLRFDERLLITIQQLRNRFGPAIINNWHNGGERKLSGYRPLKCNIGADKSYHKQGKAADMIFYDHAADYIRSYIKSQQYEFPHITFIEDDVNWLHVDVRLTERSTDPTKPIIFWSP